MDNTISFNNIFFNNIDDVSKLINYEPPFPPDGREYKTNFEEIITTENWQSLIDDSSNSYKGLIKFLLEKEIYNQTFETTPFKFNSKILTDIIQSFEFYLYKNCDSNKTIFDIKHMPYSWYNYDNIEVVLKNYYDNYYPNLLETKIYKNLINLGIEVDSDDAHFLNFICDNITEEIIIDFFINGQDMDFLKHTIFNDWYEFSSLNKVILFCINPERRRIFGGILTEKNLVNIENEENFFLMNEIYLPSRYFFESHSNPDITKIYEPLEFKNLKLEDLIDYKINKRGMVNPLIADEIYFEFKYFNLYNIKENIYYDTDKIEIEYNLAFDDKQKNKLLRKKLKKHLKKIKEIETAEDLLSCDKNLNIENELFIEMMKNSICSYEEIIEGYLINGRNINFFEYELFEEWYNLAYNLAVVEFINNKLKELKKLRPIKKKQIKNINQIFDEKVFNSFLTEDIFHKILLNENVIDKNNKPKHSFNAVAYNSFKMINSLHIEIFNTNKLKTFVEFLEVKYNFKPSNKSKFANKTNNLVSKIEGFVFKEIEKIKSSQKTNKDEFHPN